MKEAILLLLILVSCSPIVSERTEPLSVSVASTNTSGIGSLQTIIMCDAAGGISPYSYAWRLNDTRILEKCADKPSCGIYIDIIGSHKITCEVTDTDQSTLKDNITLEIDKTPVKIDAVLAFGDSLTYGYNLENRDVSNWAALYIEEFAPATLFNYARTGAKTEDVNEQLEIYELDALYYSLDEQQKLIFLWIGSNDVLYLVPINQFRNDYRRIIKNVTSIPNSRVVLINIPDVTKLSLAGEIEQGIDSLLSDFGISANLKHITKGIIKNYNNVIEQTASEYDLPVIDMFSYLEEFDDSFISDDRFHPNAEGHRLIRDKIKEEVVKSFPKTQFY